MDYLGAASLFLIEWLSHNRTTENLHRVAYTWNWDYGAPVLRWIAEQPECSRSTVKRIFLLCPAEDFLKFPTGDKVLAMHRPFFNLAARISDLWNSGFYSAPGCYFDPATEGMTVYRKQEAKYYDQGLPWGLARDFDRPEGEGKADLGTFSEGFNDELTAMLKARGISSPGHFIP
jgi:hypothetical protein